MTEQRLREALDVLVSAVGEAGTRLLGIEQEMLAAVCALQESGPVAESDAPKDAPTVEVRP